MNGDSPFEDDIWLANVSLGLNNSLIDITTINSGNDDLKHNFIMYFLILLITVY